MRLLGRAKDSQDWLTMFAGRITSISEGYTPDGHNSQTTFDVIDLQQSLARINQPARETPEGEGELSGARVLRILEAARYPTSAIEPGQIDAGTNTLQATTLAQNLSAEMGIAAASEGGAFYWDREGQPRFHQKGWLDDTTPVYFAGSDADDLAVIGIGGQIWDTSRVANTVSFARRNGSAQNLLRTVSRSAYGTRTYKRTDLDNDNDADVYDLAVEYLDRHQWDVGRIGKVTLAPRSSAAAEVLMAMEPGEVIRLAVELPGWSYTMVAYINRIEHQGSENGDHVTMLTVDDVDKTNPETGGAYSSAYSDAYRIDQGV